MDKLEELKLWTIIAKDSRLLTDEAAAAAQALLQAGASLDSTNDLRELLALRRGERLNG